MKPRQNNNPVFSKTAPYYDIIYGGRDTARDCHIIARHLNKTLAPSTCHTLLDLGCGTGTHDVEFWRRGFAVTGIDRAAAMTAIAKAKASAAHAKITYITRDILSFTSKGKYDAVVSLFDVLSYMTTNRQVEQYFSVVSAALKPKGVCMFDCWYGPGVLLSQPKIIKQSYHASGLTIVRTKTPVISYEHNTVSVHHALEIQNGEGSVTHTSEDHQLRYFFNPEIINFAAQAGLKILSWGTLNYPLRKADPPVWSVYYIAQKI